MEFVLGISASHEPERTHSFAARFRGLGFSALGCRVFLLGSPCACPQGGFWATGRAQSFNHGTFNYGSCPHRSTANRASGKQRGWQQEVMQIQEGELGSDV